MALSRLFSEIRHCTTFLWLFALAGGAPSHASAEKANNAAPATVFKWETQSISQQLAATAQSAEAWFFLTNTGSQTRKIVKIESDCDCVTTALDRKQIHPGESAVLVATFHPDTRVGAVSKSIRVISRGKKDTSKSDSLSWNLQIDSPVRMLHTDPNKGGPRGSYRIESRLTPPPVLQVPEALSKILKLQPTASGNGWLLTADRSKLPQASDRSPLYLVATLPDNQEKHIPVPAAPQ